MEAVLWYVLTGTRGGPNRVRLLRAIDERPRNANKLAEELDLDYTTVRHHLDVLVENDVVEKSGDYGAIYLRSKHTLGLLVFSVLLLAENGCALYYYLVDPTLSAWSRRRFPASSGER